MVLWSSTYRADSIDFYLRLESTPSICSMFCLIFTWRYSGSLSDYISIRNCLSFSIACFISKIVVRCFTLAKPKLYETLTSTIYRSKRCLSIGVLVVVVLYYCDWD